MWQFWIDVGGTFTDCIGVDPTGCVTQFKTLSSGCCKGTIQDRRGSAIVDSIRQADPDSFWMGAKCRVLSKTGEIVQTCRVTAFDNETGTVTLNEAVPDDGFQYEIDPGIPAPVLAIRWLLKAAPQENLPPVRVRFGTTRGTNALLTRTGARTALITTKGFADVPLIGNQDRPELFNLNIRKPSPVFSAVVEVDERISSVGEILQELTEADAHSCLVENGITTANFDSVAVCLMNAFANAKHEDVLNQTLRRLGFSEVSRSSEVSPLIRFVPRCDTTVLDAYLNPVLRRYLNDIRQQLPGSDVQVMTSIGGLVESQRFRGRDCILSGPAGGIVGFAQAAQDEGFDRAIGFDMGGTSTDVARFDGVFELENETEKAGVRIMTPLLAIETVAAGGGSICGFDGTRLFVGPQSAGASPGPACYGSGGPLTVTDLNVFLGRVLPEHFPFPLNVDAVETELKRMQAALGEAVGGNHRTDLVTLAEGLLQIANDNMSQAIRKVSVSKGFDPADYVLVSFGGAGGQHACSIARQLGMHEVLVHPFAGILSAYGIGRAKVRAIQQESVLRPLNDHVLKEIAALRAKLEEKNRAELLQQGVAVQHIDASVLSLELRYVGTDSSLVIREARTQSFKEDFEAAHRTTFGYVRRQKEIEVATIRVETVGRSDDAACSMPEVADSRSCPAASRSTEVFVDGKWMTAQVVLRDELRSGMTFTGPAIICEPTSTVFVEPQCTASVSDTGTIRISVHDVACDTQSRNSDLVKLEVFNNQFVSIAEQMGATLRRTSTSTNVRERLDFSCALFDHDGNLVVNAPHVPVHLGAMGETVRAIMDDHPEMSDGDVFVTNDPYRGGSHLPDVTIVTPVFANSEHASPSFFVANRAHHAEIGGIVPGSMPPFSKSLAEEGVLIRSRKLLDAGVLRESDIEALLCSGDFPSRCVDDNLADLAAQVAANKCGVRLLRSLCAATSVVDVQRFMKQIQSTSAEKMRICLRRIPDGSKQFEDFLDDGSRIRVKVQIAGDEAVIDFSGSSDVHAENLNANRAITTAAVLYSLRCLLNEDVPLNAGVLEPVTIVIPSGILNPPAGETPDASPAMVGGNVETSQRIVDVLLGALGLAAASQGTMNNLTFGDDTFGYYETICGGAGATTSSAGADAVHTHMTNTRLTDPEVLERRFPIRLSEFCIREGSGGDGRFCGGDGIVRELEFLAPLSVSMLSQRRGSHRPYGINGGKSGAEGKNSIQRCGESEWHEQGGRFSVKVEAGDRLRIKTPGGGGVGVEPST